MVIFRVFEGKVRPFGSKGVSSSILGTPIRTSEVGAEPQTFGGVSTGSASLFSAKHAVNKLLENANKVVQQSRAEIKEAQASRKSKDVNIVEEETETLRRQATDQQQDNINTIEERLAKIGIGKTKEEKKRKEQQKKEIQEVLKKQQTGLWETENFNISGSTVNALRLQVALKGDKEAQEILLAIGRHDWKKANKLIEEKNKRVENVFAAKSKEDSEKTAELLKKAKYVLNADGQYVATDETPEIATEEFDIPEEEAEILKETKVQAPPKIGALEVAILAQTSGGRARLKQWGWAD